MQEQNSTEANIWLTQTNSLQSFGISNHDHYIHVIKRYQKPRQLILL
jgi:hypothetical protein